jgi:chromosome segregation ATPase
VPTSDFEVFTAEDGQPALRMTAEAQIVGLRAQAQRYREEIGGYKRTQDELTDALATAEAELRELKRTMRDIGQVRGIPDEVGQGS